MEEEEGSFALWLSYILTGAGANLVSWLVLPRNAVSVGASGAVFGLFAISVLVKVIFCRECLIIRPFFPCDIPSCLQMSMDWRKILEVLILGQFVIEKVRNLIPLQFTFSSLYNSVKLRNLYLTCTKHIGSYLFSTSWSLVNMFHIIC